MLLAAVLSPSSSQGWILGETNTLSWTIGISNQLPGSFDVTYVFFLPSLLTLPLAHIYPRFRRMQDPTTLDGPLRLLAQVPLQALSIPIALAETGIPTSDNYRLTFYDSWSGQVSPSLRSFSSEVSEEARVRRSVASSAHHLLTYFPCRSSLNPTSSQ